MSYVNIQEQFFFFFFLPYQLNIWKNIWCIVFWCYELLADFAQLLISYIKLKYPFGYSTFNFTKIKVLTHDQKKKKKFFSYYFFFFWKSKLCIWIVFGVTKWVHMFVMWNAFSFFFWTIIFFWKRSKRIGRFVCFFLFFNPEAP